MYIHTLVNHFVLYAIFCLNENVFMTASNYIVVHPKIGFCYIMIMTSAVHNSSYFIITLYNDMVYNVCSYCNTQFTNVYRELFRRSDAFCQNVLEVCLRQYMKYINQMN